MVLGKGQAEWSGLEPQLIGQKQDRLMGRTGSKGPPESEKPESGKQNASSNRNISINRSSSRAAILPSAFPASRRTF